MMMNMPISFEFYLSCIFTLPVSVPFPFPLHFKFSKCLVIESRATGSTNGAGHKTNID